jgi:hypothetical protein
MRNLNKPNRYNVASIQAQQTFGGDVMQSDENGQYVEFRDYAWLLAEKQRLDNNCDYLDQKLDEELEKSAMLCGQIERLEKGIQPEGSNDAVGRAVNVLLEKEKEISFLKIEVERLEPELEQRCRELNLNIAQQAIQLRQIGELKAEVERLRKAGDDMAKTIGENGVHDNGSFHDVADSIDRWHAAKEGKQS